MKQSKYYTLRSILFFSLCILGLGLMSCKSKEKVSNTEQTTENKYQQDWVRLTRSGCFGTCPIYIVTIYGNGIVKYEGIRHTDKIGMFIGRMDPQKFDGIIKKMKEVAFLEMEDMYQAPVSDMPGITVFLHFGDIEKQVMENGDAPRELKEFQKYLDDIVSEIEEWKEVMKK